MLSYAVTVPSNLLAGLDALFTITEFPTMYARPVCTVIDTDPPSIGDRFSLPTVAVKYLSPGMPVGPVLPVEPVSPVAPVGPSMPSKFTL